MIDVDGSGTITFEELKDACKGMDYDDDKLEELMKQSDSDNDGTISLEEMKVQVILNLNSGLLALGKMFMFRKCYERQRKIANVMRRIKNTKNCLIKMM